MHARSPSAVAPATTRTRPFTCRTTVSSTWTRSASFMRATSLVTPSAVTPLTPAPTNKSTTCFKDSRSRSPFASNGVGNTEYTPASFIFHQFSLYAFAEQLLCERLCGFVQALTGSGYHQGNITRQPAPYSYGG